MSWKKVKLGEVLKQYRIEHIVDDASTYRQVSILNDGSVVLRGSKVGKEIGRKRQFKINTKRYPNTLIFTRQLLLQGSIGIASNDVNDCIVTENMPMFTIDTSKITRDFLTFFLKSEVFKSRVREIELSGSAQKSIHERTFLNLEFLLPPIEVQKTKVIELLKLKSNSDTISTELTHQLTLVKKLRQQLLQDAVQGKLVAQNKTDEPASVLLQKIKAEKAKLIAEKKLKKEKELPPIKPEEIPFEIPDNWVWCRLGEVCDAIIDCPHSTPQYIDRDTGYYGIDTNCINEKGVITRLRSLSFESYNERIKRLVPKENDIIYAREGSIGLATFIPKNKYICLGQRVMLFRPSSVITHLYLIYAVTDIGYKNRLLSMHRGMGAKHVNVKDIVSSLIALPPLAEQNRIVQKLDELMQFCNDLEASIKQSELQNEKLLQQVLREALRKEPVEA